MSRGRCLREDVSAADAGDLDDVAKPPAPPPPPVRTPPTAPTPVSREEAERTTTRVFAFMVREIRGKKKKRERKMSFFFLSFFSPRRDFDGWMKWMDGWIKR